jgi:FlaA1/EpsC-like NDP-sugar epimerase
MGEPVRIKDLAEDLIRLSGFEVADIGIAYTGVRPGEKMREDLWERDSKVTPTAHRDILRVAEDNEAIESALPSILPQLTDAARGGEPRRVETLLTRLFPSLLASAAVQTDV